MRVLGIDIGGTGIKGAPVEIRTGRLTAERLRIDTPSPATPAAVAEAVQTIADNFRWNGPLGVTLPAVVKCGVVRTAAHIDKHWIGCDAAALLSKRTKQRVAVVNDADAAGLAEARFGAGKGKKGLVLVVTLGTGIGTAVIFNGALIPNSELGHIELNGRDAEKRASNRVREKKELSWREWGGEVSDYLCTLERLLWPDLFIIGGGVSKKAEKFFRYLRCEAPVVPATLLNDAGIVGAALCAASK